MGGKGSSSSSSGSNMGFESGTSTYTPNPEAMAAYKQSLSMANNAVSAPYQPYQGQMVAGFTPDQMSAQQGVRNIQGIAQPYFNTATNLQQQAIDYSNPNNFNQYSLQQYQNPYQQQVVDATMANLAQQEAQALQQSDSRAAQQGTFGGSGQFLGRAEVARQQALANAQTLAQLNQGNYLNAQNQFNQQQQQAIQTAQSAAYGLGQLGNMAQTSALTGLNALSNSGAQQQALGQQQLTGAYNQWLAQRAYPYQQAAFYSDIAAGIGPNMGGTTTYSGTSMGMSNNQSRQSGGGGGGMGGLMSLASLLPFKDGGAVNAVDKNEEGFGALRHRKADGGASTDTSGDTDQLAQINTRLINTIGPQNLEQVARQRWISQAPSQTVRQEGFVFPQNIMRSAADGGLITSEEPVDHDYEMSDELTQHKNNLTRQRWVNKHNDPKSTAIHDAGFVFDDGILPRTEKSFGGLINGMDPIDYYKQFALSEREHLERERAQAERRRHSDRAEKAGGGGLMDMITKNSLLSGSPIQGGLGDVAKIRPANNSIENLPAQARKDFHFLNPAQDVAKGITGQMAKQAAQGAAKAAESAGKGGGGSGSGGGGGMPKMPSMKSAKPGVSPTSDALGENSPGPAGSQSSETPSSQTESLTPDNQPDVSNDNMPNEYLSAPEDVPNAPEINSDNLGEMASPDIEGGGFGAFELPMFKRGGRTRRKRAAGGSGAAGVGSLGEAGGASTPLLLGETGAGLGSLALGQHSSDNLGFGDLKASQQKYTGDNLVNNWMNQYKSNYTGGPQKSPTEQGMPAMPGPDYYKTPLDLSEFTNTTGPAHTAKNQPVEGYFTSLGSNQVNPDTGLFNVKYDAPYYGNFYKDGGRVKRDVGGKLYDLFHPMISRIANGIASVETGGRKNPYSVIGPRSKRGDVPYGKYQIMGANIPKWGAEAGYKGLTPSQFLRDPKIQEDVARTQFAKLYGKSNNPTHVAGEWLGGPGWRTNKHTDVLGTSVPKYMQKFNVAFNNGAQPNNRFASQQPSTQQTSFQRAPDGQRWSSAGNFQPTTNTPPAGSVLNRINPADPSGPLLGDATGKQPAQLPVTQRVADANGMTAPQPIVQKRLALSDFNPIGTAEAGELPRNNRMKGPSIADAMPRVDNGPMPSVGDQRAWGLQNSTPTPALFDSNPAIADAQGTPTLDAEGKVAQQPGFIIDPNQNSGFAPFGMEGDVANPMQMPGATNEPKDFGSLPLTPFTADDHNAPSVEAPAPSAQPKTDKKPEASKPTGQTFGDWRDQEPWKSDPIGGMFDSLAGDTSPASSGADNSADLSNAFDGLDLPDLGFARGGTVRRGYATDGAVDENPLSAISDGLGSLFDGNDKAPVVARDDANPLSALGEGVSNIGNSLSNGFGELFGGNDEPRTPRRHVALTENKPSEPAPRQSDGFGSIAEDTQQSAPANTAVASDNGQQAQQGFGGLGILPTHGFLGDGTDYSMSPFRRGLLAAGLATMASHQASPLAALGEGAGHGLGVWQNAQADYDAQQLKQKQLKADQDFARRITSPSQPQPNVTPEKVSSPAEPQQNPQSRIDGLMERRARILAEPAYTPRQEQIKKSEIRNIEWEIGQLHNQEKANQGTIGTTVDEFGSPIQVWKSGPKAGQRYVAPPAETPAASPNATPSTENTPNAAPTNLSGDAYLKKLPADVQNEVRLIAEGSMELPKGVRGQALWKAVTNYEPGFDMTKYNARRAMRTGYADQTGTKPGAQILFGNTAIGHGAELAELAVSLDNYDPEILNKPINWLRENYGGDFAEKVNRYNALRHKYVDEMQKFYKGSGGGTEAERNAAAAILDPNKGPRALVSALYEDARDMESKLIPLQEKWRETMGPRSGEYKILGDNAQRQLKKLGKIYQDTTGKDAEFHGEVSTQEIAAPPPREQLEVGKIYEGAKGRARWTGTGFVPVD